MEKVAKKGERRIEKELLGILIFVLFLVVIFLIASAIFKRMNTFEYEGLTFTKESLGDIRIYHYYYYFRTQEGGLIKYNLYLRNDPRTNDVPIEADNNIEFSTLRPVYISLDTINLQECREAVLAVADLTRFLIDNQVNVRSGNLNEEIANATGTDYITCENKPKNPVIAIHSGNETKITIDGSCYDISISNCEILKATEKFKLQAVLDARQTNVTEGIAD